MGRPGAYKSDKRKKELLRQKKQEEKRLRRFKKDESGTQDEPITVSADMPEENKE